VSFEQAALHHRDDLLRLDVHHLRRLCDGHEAVRARVAERVLGAPAGRKSRRAGDRRWTRGFANPLVPLGLVLMQECLEPVAAARPTEDGRAPSMEASRARTRLTPSRR
jgi:hypothetical protein